MDVGILYSLLSARTKLRKCLLSTILNVRLQLIKKLESAVSNSRCVSTLTLGASGFFGKCLLISSFTISKTDGNTTDSVCDGSSANSYSISSHSSNFSALVL